MSTTKKYIIGGIIILIVTTFVYLKISQMIDGSAVDNNFNESTGAVELGADSYAVPKELAYVDGDWLIGNLEAGLKIFVYEDYASSFSADLAKTLSRLQTDFASRVAVIVRPYLGNSEKAAENTRLMICASEQGKWLKMRELLFLLISGEALNNSENNNLEKIGLDEVKLTDCLTNLKKSGKMEQLSQLTQAQGVQGAPTIFVGSEMIIGARPYEDFFDSNGDKIEGLKTVVEKALQ